MIPLDGPQLSFMFLPFENRHVYLRSPMKTLFASLSILALIAVLSGCGNQNNEPISSTDSPPSTALPGSSGPSANTTPAAPVDPEATVVTVNGTAITEGEVNEEVEQRIAVQMQRMPAGMEIPSEQKQFLRKSVVDMLVDKELISQKLAEKNIAVNEEQVAEAIQTIAGERSQSLEELEKEIAQHGLTMADLQEQVGFRLRMDTLMKEESGVATVTEEEAMAFYEQNPQHFEQPEQVKASHILCGKRGITEAEYPAELEKIQAAKARLDSGESFADVARAVSSCPSSTQGGDLGFFGKGQMDPAFEKAAFEMQVGETSDIVKSSFGYHLIQVTDKRAAGKTPFDDVKEEITQHLTQQKQQEFWADYQQGLKDNATIAYSPAEQRSRDAAEQAEQEMMRQQIMRQMPSPQ